MAILNTTLRMTGRPAELRDRLFARTLTVRVISPLDAPTPCSLVCPALRGGVLLTASTCSPSPMTPWPPLRSSGRWCRPAWDVLSIGESRHSLQDVYLELIGEQS